jgi:hypothetical protein
MLMLVGLWRHGRRGEVVGRGGCGEKSWVEVNGGNVGAIGAVQKSGSFPQSWQTKNLNYYHALHLTLQTPFTTHNSSMPLIAATFASLLTSSLNVAFTLDNSFDVSR